jgi:hypothetical protein
MTILWPWHEIGMTAQEAESIVLGIGSWGDFGVFNVGAVAWRENRTGQCVVGDAASSPGISFALIRAMRRAEMLQFVRSGATVILDLHLPTDQPGIILSCRIDLGSQDLSQLRRSFHQTANHRSSALAIAGMTLLLAVCGWIVGGTEGVHRALTGRSPEARRGTTVRQSRTKPSTAGSAPACCATPKRRYCSAC